MNKTQKVSHIIYALSEWKDFKFDTDLICIDTCKFNKDKPNEYTSKYSMPYNKPKLKFIILCYTEKDCINIQDILFDELDKYSTANMMGNWYKKFDIKLVKKILKNYNYKYEILLDGDSDLKEFE